VFIDDRDAVQARLKELGIPTSVHYPLPLNQQPAYKDLCCPDCTPISATVAKRVMSLPMSPDIKPADQDRIVAELTGW
jgi:UDP-2-acetamido-2-deoxy-ribo-hexuluronate aminotransferase